MKIVVGASLMALAVGALAAEMPSSFPEAKKIWESSSDRKDYQTYATEFSQFSNHFHLDEKDGCYSLGKEPVELMLLITHKAGEQYARIENVFVSVDNAKSRCFAKTYRGLKTKIPPFVPLVLQMGMG
jgi:hypothetical protein